MFRSFTVSIVFILFALTIVACAPTQVEAPASPATVPASVPIQIPNAAATATPLPSVTPLPQTTSTPAPVSRYEGFVVYDEATGKFAELDFQGKPLGFTVDAGPQFVRRSPEET